MCDACWKGENDLSLKRWSRYQINDLPDEAFAVIEPAYSQGKTRNKNARHLPHHLKEVVRGLDSKDNIDAPHLKNVLSIVSQIAPVTNSITPGKLRQIARDHLNKHSFDLKLNSSKTKSSSQSLAIEMAEDSRIKLPENIKLVGDNSLSTVFSGSMLNVNASELKEEQLQEGEDLPTLESIQPKEEDFILVDFRSISKTIIPGRYFNFTKDNVLKDSLGMLISKPVLINHQHEVGAEVGVVIEEFWDDSSEPAGINSRYKIDAVGNPRIGRSLLAKPPMINSTSINIVFDWEKSHPDMDSWDFWGNLGKKVDGKLVTIDVTEVLNKHEASLVWAGADWFAKNKGIVKN